MPELKLDATTARPPGEVDVDRYLVTVAGFSDVKYSKEKNEPMIAAYCDVIEGVDTGEKFKGKRIFNNLMLAGEGASFFVDFWNKCFPNDESMHLDVGEVIDVNTDELIGKQLYLVMTEREYPKDSGLFRTNVERVLPVT